MRIPTSNCPGVPEKKHELVLNLCSSFDMETTECVVTGGYTFGPTNAYDFYIPGTFCRWSGAESSQDVSYGKYSNSTKSFEITYEGHMQHNPRPWKRTIVAKMICDENFEEKNCLSVDFDEALKTTTYYVSIRSSHACPI